MRIFPITAAIILAILAIILFQGEGDFFPSHEIAEQDKPAVSEAQEVLRNLNLTMLRLDFSTEKGERYSFRYHSKGFFGPAVVSLTSFGYHWSDFQKVSKQLIRIFKKAGIKIEPKKINNWISNFQQTIELGNHFPEQLPKIIEKCGSYFYHLEVVNWRVVPDLR